MKDSGHTVTSPAIVPMGMLSHESVSPVASDLGNEQSTEQLRREIYASWEKKVSQTHCCFFKRIAKEVSNLHELFKKYMNKEVKDVSYIHLIKAINTWLYNHTEINPYHQLVISLSDDLKKIYQEEISNCTHRKESLIIFSRNN